MITLEVTAGELLFVHHLLDQQSGTYLDLKKVWRLEDKLTIDDDTKLKIGWVEKDIGGRKVTTVENDKHSLTFELEDQDALALKTMFNKFNLWPKRTEVRTLGQKLEEIKV